MALFELAELATFLGVSEVFTDQATLARELATGLIEDEIGVVASTTSVVVLPIDDYGRIDLPMTRITSISGVTVGGIAAEYEWQRPYPRLRLTEWSWIPDTDWQTAEVTVVHGWTVIPDVVKAVALSVAGRVYSNPEGIKQESIDDYSRTRAGGDEDLAGVTLTDAERRTLHRSSGSGAWVAHA